MGLTYKENVPDTRQSPVKKIIKMLKEFDCEIYGYDPLIDKREIENFNIKALDTRDVIVDCVIMTVGHDVFKNITLEDLKKFITNRPVLIDVRGLFDKSDAIRNEFIYHVL